MDKVRWWWEDTYLDTIFYFGFFNFKRGDISLGSNFRLARV